MEELQAEREELFGFTPEDQVAWGNAPKDHKHSADFLSEIEQARKQAAVALEEVPQVPDAKLTHVSEDGKSVHMVNVGSKQVTKRRAVAEAKVIFPPDALEVLQAQQWTTAKGPIFDTAKISGIMATKKTSDLIPMCHPLPLDQAQIEIDLIDNTAIVRCECNATHKTGVEMEALTGASIAALTIYDMVKAVSHQVRIQETRLIHKSGGKRTVDN